MNNRIPREAAPSIKFGRDDPHMRWLVFPRTWNRLHRVVAAELASAWGEEGDAIEWVGVAGGRTACGLKGDLHMPGPLSRMGLPRCAHCCKAVGVPPGDGSPYNGGIQEP